MKIAKALKLKNRLAGEISRLKGIVQAKNVREATQKEVYDVKRIATVDLINVIDDLVLVKTVIAMSNAAIVKLLLAVIPLVYFQALPVQPSAVVVGVVINAVAVPALRSRSLLPTELESSPASL